MPHEHANRLIYAADLNFSDCVDLKAAHKKAAVYLEKLVIDFAGLGITIKGSTVFRFFGWTALAHLQSAGYGIFGDYKILDVRGTVENDASWLRLFDSIKILTIAEDVHPDVFTSLAETLPNAIIAPTNPLTDLEDEHFKRRGEVSREHAVRHFFARVAELPARGVICSPDDLKYTPPGFSEGWEIITPAIRPAFARVENDKNAVNALTPREAILAGSSQLVVGSPIRHNDDMRGNAMRILDEIGEALIEKNGR